VGGSPGIAQNRQVTDDVGLYLAPPEDALVLSIDEKSNV